MLVQTSAHFDFDASCALANVRYVGPELGDPSWAEPWASPWPKDSKDPLVLVAFSTTFMGQASLLERIIRALGPLRVRALVTVGPALAARHFHAPSHVVVCGSAPHSKVLPDAALVVTHGGHGTVIRALAHGVPLLCIPMGRDQSDNAARAVALGAALTVSRHASAREIRQAIVRALDDTSLHAAARRVQTVLATEHIGDPAVEELERLLVHEDERSARESSAHV